MTVQSSQDRPLSQDESRLASWMLEHGSHEARSFIPQLSRATVTSWRCPCGCASINFRVAGTAVPQDAKFHPIVSFIFGDEGTLSGIFVFEMGGVLGGIEVYGLDDHVPTVLPSPEDLRLNPHAPPQTAE